MKRVKKIFTSITIQHGVALQVNCKTEFCKQCRCKSATQSTIQGNRINQQTKVRQGVPLVEPLTTSEEYFSGKYQTAIVENLMEE